METYDEEYYKRCKDKGIDYAFYGNWQKQYAKLVTFMTGIYMMDYRNKSMLDIGTGCGVNLKAFKETNIFDMVVENLKLKVKQNKQFKAPSSTFKDRCF